MRKIENNTKQRIMWLDILKGICMFFIVMSHSRPPMFYTWIYTPFFLTSFFFVSGFTFNPRENAVSFFKHKAKTILFPYWIFGIINAALAFVVDKDNILDRLLGLLLSINRVNDDLWFIMCLFSMETIFYGIWRLLFRKRIHHSAVWGGAISILLCAFGYCIVKMNVQIPLQLETALIMVPFMYMGYMLKKSDKGNAFQKPMISLVFVAVYLVYCLLAKNTVNIHGEKYSDFLVFLSQAALGTVSVIILSKCIEKRYRINRAVNTLVFIGQNTFVYYAFQSKAIRLLDVINGRLPFTINDYIRNILYAVIVCLILVVPAIIINRWFPFILGRKRTETA